MEGVSRRQILRETGMHWRTLKKILAHSQPPGYRQQQPRRKTKLEDKDVCVRRLREGYEFFKSMAQRRSDLAVSKAAA